jgi:hypothetical protein
MSNHKAKTCSIHVHFVQKKKKPDGTPSGFLEDKALIFS